MIFFFQEENQPLDGPYLWSIEGKTSPKLVYFSIENLNFNKIYNISHNSQWERKSCPRLQYHILMVLRNRRVLLQLYFVADGVSLSESIIFIIILTDIYFLEKLNSYIFRRWFQGEISESGYLFLPKSVMRTEIKNQKRSVFPNKKGFNEMIRWSFYW